MKICQVYRDFLINRHGRIYLILTLVRPQLNMKIRQACRDFLIKIYRELVNSINSNEIHYFSVIIFQKLSSLHIIPKVFYSLLEKNTENEKFHQKM